MVVDSRDKLTKFVGRELKRPMAKDGNSSIALYRVQDNTRLKKLFYNRGPPNSTRVNKGDVYMSHPGLTPRRNRRRHFL